MQGKTIMRMTSEAFHTWSQHLQLSAETEALIATIRASPPVRRPSGHAGNITGRYPSPKMGVSIQFESDRVEFWAIFGMERDADVLEYYDQSSRIPLSYRAPSGHRTTQWHTPDFFVLRRQSAGWEEWKPADALETLAVEKPARYQHAGTGQWHCPPGEAYAEQLGLTYRLRSSAELHPLEIQNLKFLQDFWAHEVPPHPEQEALALAHIQAHPGIKLRRLLALYPDLPVDVLWVLLSTCRGFTNLSATLLMRHEQVTLYAEEQLVPQGPQGELTQLSTPWPEAPVAWDGRLWRIEGWGEQVQLRPEVGEPLTMPQAEFESLKQEGSLWVVGSASPSPMTPEVRQQFAQASQKAQQAANRRMKEMLAYARGEPTTASRGSVQRWWKAFQQAKAEHGCGYLGLLDQVAERGNRSQRIEPVSLQLLEAALQTHYAAPQGKSAAAVYRLYREQCAQHGIPPASQQTFYRARARFTTNEGVAQRKGARAAYASQPFAWLDQTTPRHGERPFALAHLDHTELDMVLVSSVTGKPLGKPWVTFLTDAYSRHILACYLTYDPPSYRSVMMALRICVQRHQRLPQECFVDRGPEFGSVYFETLLTRYFVTKKDRPTAHPRMGSVIERLFGTTQTEFIYTLLGNTQASKSPRHLTRAVDPSRLAVWTLERLYARLSQYVYEVYDQLDHPALGQSPRDAFAQGMQLAGLRTHRLIPYSEEFLILTCPTTRTHAAKLDAARGVVVNGLRYSHPLMRSSREAGKRVEVRYEPFDMSIAYAFVDGQWLTCAADAFLQVQGRSEREWDLLLDEWREQQRVHHRKRVSLDSARLATFLQEVLTEEALLSQQQRDLESAAIREAIVGSSKMARLPPSQVEVDLDEELDLATLPRYEEYG
jgi:putative transposase